LNLIRFTPEDLHNMTTWYSIAFGIKNNSKESDEITHTKIMGLLASEISKQREKFD
jgi:hypothetical protein